MNTNVAIISATITVLALVLSIFGASWLNQRNMERLIEQLDRKFDARFETLLTEIRRLDQRIDGLERRMDQRFAQVDQRFAQMEQRFDRIERQLEAIFKPLLPKQ